MQFSAFCIDNLTESDVLTVKNIFPKRYEKSLSYKDENDVKLSLSAGVLLCRAFPNVKETDLCVNEFGKPLFKDEVAAHFNLSGKGKFCVMAVSDKPIGVDIELYRSIDLRLAERYFTDDEKSLVKTAHDFLQLWTLKESFLKCVGKGITVSLKSFSVVGLLKNGRDVISGKRYYAVTFDYAKDYVVSVCGEESEIQKFSMSDL